MSTEIISIETKLKALYDLQIIDTKIAEIRTLRGELPMEVRDLEDELAGLETRLRKYESEQNEAEEDVSQRKAFIKDSTARRQKYEQQINNIKNNREYDSLNKEIELLGLEIQITEKKVADLMAFIVLKKEEIAVIQETLSTRTTDLNAKRAELDTIVAETQREEKALMELSAVAEEKIEERLLVAYKRLRDNSRNHLAVVAITRDACGGCFNKIPPQRQLDIRQRKKIIVCEHCGRIQVDHDLAVEADGTLQVVEA